MTEFSDISTEQAGTYYRYRPSYPGELFEYLSRLVKNHRLAWDCGTGNGQSARGLAQFFENVIATDPSREQIRKAVPHPKIQYRVEKSEASSLKDNSVDLITVAQAVHWFDFNKFYAEARRVLKKDGIIAVWAYSLPIISAKIDTLIRHYHDEILDGFWQKENRYVTDAYRTIPFPFEEIKTPGFTIQKEISKAELLGFLSSWSATSGFLKEKKTDPIQKIEEDLHRFWGNPEDKKTVYWNIYLKVGRQT